MTRSDLVARIADLNPHLRRQGAEAVVSAILARIAKGLAAGDRVELRDFGSFVTRGREGRTGRNPRSGAKVDVPAKAAVAFKSSKTMRARLNP